MTNTEIPALKRYQKALEMIAAGMPHIRVTRRFSEAKLIATSALTGELDDGESLTSRGEEASTARIVMQAERENYAAVVEGDSDNPLRVARANAILNGDHDDEVPAAPRPPVEGDRQPSPTILQEAAEALDSLVGEQVIYLTGAEPADEEVSIWVKVCTVQKARTVLTKIGSE